MVDILWNNEIIENNKTNSLILNFNNFNTIDNLREEIKEQFDNIKKAKSVFIFRTWWNLSFEQIKIITSLILKINKSIILFIDQEWWKINRFIDFNDNYNISTIYQNDEYLKIRFSKIDSNSLKEQLFHLFKNKVNFPSLGSIWKLYGILEWHNKDIFIEIITYLKLKTLKDKWINSYWLVCDLNLWNSVITELSRSFSSNIEDYKLFWKHIINAAEKLNITVYLKHFPWHGIWSIDSHNWVIQYTEKNIEYLKSNIDVFKYISKEAKKRWVKIGLMAWHFILPNSIQNNFINILNDFDYLITDDLSMKWYKKIWWKKYKDYFISTDELLNNKNKKLILVDTRSAKIL